MEIQWSNQFKKDYKKFIKQDKKLSKLIEELAYLLIARLPLPKKYLCHSLIGNWQGYNECHIKPDILIIYKFEQEILKFARIGSHSELFKK